LDRKLGRNDQARADYEGAIVLFKEVDDRYHQALALASLGSLGSRENPQQAAAYFVEAAQLFEMFGMTERHDAALREAEKLYKR